MILIGATEVFVAEDQMFGSSKTNVKPSFRSASRCWIMPPIYVLVRIGSRVELSSKASYYSIPESSTNTTSRYKGTLTQFINILHEE